MARNNIKPVSQGLSWLTKILDLFASQSIFIPDEFRSQAIDLESELKNDVSGLVDSILDFAISASQVDFSIESDNETIREVLNNWLFDINSSMRGKIPTGVNALAKEYFRERWKKSSFLLLRTKWETIDGYRVPTKLWFVDGKDILIADDKESKMIGNQEYSLQVNDKNSIPLNNTKDHKIFVQKPFEDWATDYPTPYLVKRGVLYNLKFMRLLSTKGSNVLAKAIEYLMLLKKGDAELVKLNNPDFIYSQAELTEIKNKLQQLMDEMKASSGTPLYTTNFDTMLEHLIPEYGKILSSDLSTPIERRILAGLGFVEIVEGLTSSRKDAVLNPKVFENEIKQGLRDFSMLLQDVLMTIIEENKALKPKLMNSKMIEIRTSPLKAFTSKDSAEIIRNLYDRGLLSKRTTTELLGDIDFDQEVERRKGEDKEGFNDEKNFMYPPVIQNTPTAPGVAKINPNDPGKDKIPDAKKGPNKKNFTAANKEQVALVSGRKNKHTHELNIEFEYNEEGAILSIEGVATEADGHTHTVSKLDETDPAPDGHVHRIRFEKADLPLEQKTKLIKFQNLLKQSSLLEKLDTDNETA